MATTTYFGGTLPTVGGDSGAWGDEINTLMSLWDAGISAAGRVRPQLSAAGSSSSLSISAGGTLDSSFGAQLIIGSAMTKTTGAWAVGSGNGGLLSGVIAANTWYNVWGIMRPDTGVVDVGLDVTTNATPTLPTNYTKFRLWGSVLTDNSSQFVKFTQSGDRFIWQANSSPDINGSSVPATTGRGQAILTYVPPRQVIAELRTLFLNTTSAGIGLTLSDLSVADVAVTSTTADLITQVANQLISGRFFVRTSAAKGVGARASVDANNSLFLSVLSYIDPLD